VTLGRAEAFSFLPQYVSHMLMFFNLNPSSEEVAAQTWNPISDDEDIAHGMCYVSLVGFTMSVHLWLNRRVETDFEFRPLLWFEYGLSVSLKGS
jgi:hypothetical protein